MPNDPRYTEALNRARNAASTLKPVDFNSAPAWHVVARLILDAEERGRQQILEVIECTEDYFNSLIRNAKNPNLGKQYRMGAVAVTLIKQSLQTMEDEARYGE